MKEALTVIDDFVQDRPLMRDNNLEPERMEELFLEEVNEMLIELRSGDVEALGKELVDVLWFTMSIALLHGIDLEKEFKEKTVRNLAKRPAHLYQEGSYEEAELVVRETWTPEREREFYE